jgi:tetratricopeptide (TPR) repeat protein
MRLRPTRLRRAAAAQAARPLLLVLLLSCVCLSGARAQQRTLPDEGARRFTIQGQVTLPDGRPAANARVRLTGALGVNREALANDAGRYEFTELPAGSYQLEARSPSDDNFSSGSTLTNTTRTATNSLTANIALRAEPVKTSGYKPAVISAADAGQKVPPKARKAFEEGVKLRGDNEPVKALASFTQAIELYPDYYQALTARADLQLIRRQLPEAAADFDRALKSNPRYGSALRGAGYCKLVRGQFAEAVEYFDKAATAEPGSARSFLLLGIANFELDRREPAKLALQRALKLDAAQSVRARLYLANIYAREQQFQQAADELRAYLEAAPSDPEAVELRKVEALWRARPNGQ